MITLGRVRGLPLGAEPILAFAIGAGGFALAAVTFASINSDVIAAVAGVVYLGAVIAVAGRVSIVFAVPMAMAGLLAFDWYVLPPTHPLEFPDSANLVDVIVSLSVAVLVGELAAHASRRAKASERARREIADEQAALRRVATLVAQDAPADALFAAVAAEAGRLLDVDGVRIGRYEGERELVHVSEWARPGRDLPPYERATLEGRSVSAEVLRTGRAARIDDYEYITVRPAFARGVPATSAVGAPVVVEGRLWGVMIAWSGNQLLPPDTEPRLTDFAELVATAISNTEARARTARLADQQAALRRVATLVAEDAAPAAVFARVTDEVAREFGSDDASLWRDEGDGTATVVAVSGVGVAVGTRMPTDGDGVIATVLRERRPYSMGDTADRSGAIVARGRELGIRSAIGCPVMVSGRLWGALGAARTATDSFPPDTELELAQFADLVATAIANAQARADIQRLAEEQAGLRRVATLVAAGCPPDEIFAAVADEVQQLVGNDVTSMFRVEPGDTLTLVAVRARGPVPDGLVGKRLPMRPAFARFLAAGQPVRLEGRTADLWMRDLPEAEPLALRSALGVPIVIGGRPWGATFMCDTKVVERPPETERSIVQFSELLGTAIANAQARDDISGLAEEQAALRRVATLVAEEAPLSEVFARVAEEASQALGNVDFGLWRQEGDGTATLVAVAGTGPGARLGVGYRQVTHGGSVIGFVHREGVPGRTADYSAAAGPAAERARALGIRSALARPVHVGERLWGAMQVVSYDDDPIPQEVETRIGRFGDLVATAIANSEARAEVERLAEEQAALRRVATLVAHGADAAAVLDAVAEEIKRVLRADHILVCRYETGAELTLLAHQGSSGRHVRVGMRISHAGHSVEAVVRRTEQSARLESCEGPRGVIAELARAAGMRVAVGAPVVVDGRLWGVVSAFWSEDQAPPADTEARMAQFAQLLDTAIANADSRAQLTASRARLLTASDEARRRVVRDLHDGAQQRLVHTIIKLKLAQSSLRENDGQAESLLADALTHAEQSNEELRELAHGVLPSVLLLGGLRAGLRSLAARLDVPVRVDVPAERFPAELESSAYFVVAEALTNVVKHADAEFAAVRARIDDGMLRLEVRDDGRGGADAGGHGLVGMSDRVTALGGRIEIESPPGSGTRVTATLPLS